jgi:hypothetical protein
MVWLWKTWLKKNEPKFHGYQSLCLHWLGEKGCLGILIREDVTFKPKQVIPFPAGLLESQSIEIYTNCNSINILNAYNPCKNIPLGEPQHYTNQLGNSFILIGDLNGHSPLLDSWIHLSGQSIEKLMEMHNPILLNDADTSTYIDNCWLNFMSRSLHNNSLSGGPWGVASGQWPRQQSLPLGDHIWLWVCKAKCQTKEKLGLEKSQVEKVDSPVSAK